MQSQAHAKIMQYQAHAKRNENGSWELRLFDLNTSEIVVSTNGSGDDDHCREFMKRVVLDIIITADEYNELLKYLNKTFNMKWVIKCKNPTKVLKMIKDLKVLTAGSGSKKLQSKELNDHLVGNLHLCMGMPMDHLVGIPNISPFKVVHRKAGSRKFARENSDTQFNLKPVFSAISIAIASIATGGGVLPAALAAMKSSLEQPDEIVTFTFNTAQEKRRDEKVEMIIREDSMAKYIIRKEHSSSQKCGGFLGFFRSDSYASVHVKWSVKVLVAQTDEARKILNEKQLELAKDMLKSEN